MPFDPAYLIKLPPRITHHRYSRRDTVLYALGIGAGHEPAIDLAFVYEDGLKSLPTMAVVLGYPGFWQKEPRYGIDWKRVLHAEQSVVFQRAMPPEGEVRSEFTIESIVDKGAGKGALLWSKRQIYDTGTDTLLATVTQVSFLRGDGGHGGSNAAAPPPHAIPTSPADVVLAVSTRPEQALIYRLSGDYNPLHVDPEVALEAGLPGPILHGLCTYGIAGRVLLRQLCGDDPARMKRLDCRFTAPVLPGEALAVSIWREEPGRAAYRVEVPARGIIAIDHGYMEYQV